MTPTDDATGRDGRTDQTPLTGDGRRRPSRRRVLAAGASVAGALALAGCGDGGDDSGDGTATEGGDGTVTAGDPGGATELGTFRGSGPLVEQRDRPGGTPIDELPDLSGHLDFYLGGGEGGLYLQLIRLLTDIYPDFTFNHSLDASSSLANRIIEESRAGQTQADVFVAVDAGSLGRVADQGATRSLPSSVTDTVPADYRTDQWVGIAGRARAVPYNTNELSAEEVPDTVQDFPETAALEGAMGWAPTYGAFHAFVTTMLELRGESETRAWLNAMQDHGVTQFPDEFRVSNNVADGALRAGFANHYYALRVRNARPSAPLGLAFTSGDAGALINVSGAEILQGTDDVELAENFLRHLLSSEAQEFFATRTFAYPTVPDVAPVGGLPSIGELNPPDVPLSALSNVQPTIDLLRDTGVLR